MLKWLTAMAVGARCRRCADVDFEADAEHEEDDAELAEKPQDIERRVGKEKRVGRRPDVPEERRPEQQAGGNLPDDGRLAQRVSRSRPTACVARTMTSS